MSGYSPFILADCTSVRRVHVALIPSVDCENIEDTHFMTYFLMETSVIVLM